MATPITLPITYTVDDWVRAMIAMRERIWWVKYNYLALPVFFFVAIFMFAFFGRSESSFSIAELAGIGVVTAVVIGVVAFLITKFLTPWAIRRSVARQLKSSPAMCAPHIIVLSDVSYQSTSEFASLTVNWTGFIDAVETKTDFLLFAAKRFCYFIPKRACPSETECSSIRALIAREVGFDRKRKS